MSHPTRVRGLKPVVVALVAAPLWSHPTRVRGLKLVLVVCWLSFAGRRTLRGCVD